MLVTTATVPLTIQDKLEEGDTVFMPCGTKMFRIWEYLAEDPGGVYGGDFGPVTNPYEHRWVHWTPEELVKMGARIEPPTKDLLPC